LAMAMMPSAMMRHRSVCFDLVTVANNWVFRYMYDEDNDDDIVDDELLPR